MTRASIGMRHSVLIAALALAIVAIGAGSATAAPTTVTLGPSLSGSPSASACPPSSGVGSSLDCAYVNDGEPAGVIAQAPADGTITTWRALALTGTAKLLVLASAANGQFTIVGASDPVTCPGATGCATAPMPASFTTNLPIKAGQYIGVELTSGFPCPVVSSACTTLGTGPTGATAHVFDSTPAASTPATPDGSATGQLVNADETVPVSPPDTVTLAVSPTKVTAGGVSTATATAAVWSPSGPLVPGQSVSFTSSDTGEKVGPVTDHGDGTYTATITSSPRVGSATITATDTSDATRPTATGSLTQVAPTVKVSPGAAYLAADGSSTTGLTVTVTGAQGEAVTGQHIAVSVTGPARVSTPQETSGGTYVATITAGRSAGTATLTATDSSVSPSVAGQTRLPIRSVKKPKACVVPKLAGKTVAAARRAVKKAGCAVGKTNRRASTKVRTGHVISSSPKAGAHRRHGSRVGLVVSRGRH